MTIQVNTNKIEFIEIFLTIHDQMETVAAPTNQGKPWNKVEYDTLQNYLDQKKSTEEIAKLMGRTSGGIHAAIKKKINLMRKTGMSNIDIAAKINWSVENVVNVGSQDVKVSSDGKILKPKNKDRKKVTEDRFIALEAKIDGIYKLLAEILGRKIEIVIPPVINASVVGQKSGFSDEL